MKKKILIAGAALAMTTVFTACENKNNNAVKDATKEQLAKKPAEAKADLSVLEVDSVEVDEHWALSDPTMAEFAGETKPGLHCVIDVPSFEQSPVLANAIMEWMNERCFGGVYKGDLKDVKAMIAAYIESCQEEEGGMGPDAQYEFEVRKVYENDKVVTFMMHGYDYAFGAAHGMPYINGASFRKSDGKLFGWNMFVENADLQASLKKGLKEYFDVTTDEELEENLLMDDVNSVNYLPKPATDPWITKDGVEMIYQSYEVACYAAGQPNVVIPTDVVKKMLTASAVDLLN